MLAEPATGQVSASAQSSSPSTRQSESASDRSRRLRPRTTGAAVADIRGRLTRVRRAVTELLLGWSREPPRAAARSEVVAALARRLPGCADSAAVFDETWLAITQLCRLTPGLRVLAVTPSGTTWRVTRACGELVSTPMGSSARLPVASVGPIMVERPLNETYTFDRAAGQACSWVAISVPTTSPAIWLILGTPPTSRHGALASLRTTAGLMSLALRQHEARHETPSSRDDPPPHDAGTPAHSPARFALGVDSHQMPDAPLDLDTVIMAVSWAGDQMVQQLSLLLHQHNQPDTDVADKHQFASLASDMVHNISQEVSERVTAALLTSGVVRDETPAARAAQTAPEPVTVTQQAACGDEVAATPLPHAGQQQPRPFATKELKAAVEADEIVMRYQPILSTTGNRCTGVEALPRWQHPDHGLLNPTQFLNNAAEREGTRIVGAHVLRQAVTEGSRWHQQFPDRHIPVHVNVSAHQLDDQTFAETVRDCLHQSALPAQSLVLEVTDNPAALSPTAQAQLHAVAANGVQIAVSLDEPVDPDSGNKQWPGWQDLPVKIIKLDAATAHAARATSDNRPETVIEMARRLGLRTVAQRVEDTRQRDRLRDAGVNSTQGYLHAPPITAEALTDWLQGRPRSESRNEAAQAVSVLAIQGAA